MTIDFETVIGMVIIGLFTGFGCAIGNYIAQRSFIKHFELLISSKKILNNNNKGKK